MTAPDVQGAPAEGPEAPSDNQTTNDGCETNVNRGGDLGHQLLRALWPEPVEGFITLCSDVGGAFHLVDSIGVADPDGLVGKAATLGGNCWFSVSALRWLPVGGRGTRDDVGWVPTLWSDLDEKCAPGLDLERFLHEDLGDLTPSVVVATGHGLHGYWLLDEPVTITDAEDWRRVEDLNERLRLHLNRTAEASLRRDGLDDAQVVFDKVGDVPRVLRLPGTSNHKSNPPRPVTICWAGDWRRSLDEYAELLPEATERAAGPIRTLTNVDLLAGVDDGARDDTLFRACCRWYREFVNEPDGGDAEVTKRALEMAANCRPPMDERTVRAKVESAKGYAVSDERVRLSDDGNALLYVEQHEERLRYVRLRRGGEWFAWNGARWEPGADLMALALARETARSLTGLANEVADDEDRKKALDHAKRSLNATRIEAIPRLARADERLTVEVTYFDTNSNLLNTPSGTVDLTTGALLPHRREDYLSKMTTVAYDPTATAPYWERWIKWAMSERPDWVEAAQRIVGYAVTGSSAEQKFFLLHGGGDNGKSTLLSLLELMLGDYALHAEPDLLSPRDGAHTTGVADLMGRRFVVAVETKEGKRLDERQVKQLTGGDTITARHMHRDNVSFKPTHTIFFAVNHLPKVDDDTHAMWRRIVTVPFLAQIAEDAKVKDLHLWMLENEGPGILRWAVEGALKWRAEGLLIPDEFRRRTEEYRSSQDAFGEFVDDCLVADPVGVASKSEIWRRYQRWCLTEGVAPREVLNRGVVIERLLRRFAAVAERRAEVDGKYVRALIGLRLRGEGE